MDPCDQTVNASGILFSPIIHMILDYKIPEFELDPFTLKFVHHLTPHGTEIKKTTSDSDFDQSILKRCVILYPLKQKKYWRVVLIRS